MERLIKTSLIAALILGSTQGFSQANHWAIAPNISINANTGATSYYSTAGLDLSGGCVTANKKLAVISATSSYFAFSGCGIYNASGTAVGPGGPADVFVIPGQCKKFYSIGWQSVWGPPHSAALILTLLDATDPSSVSEVSSSTIMSAGGQGISVAATPLRTDGSRTVYISESTTLSALDIAADGTVGALTTAATLPAILDTRTNMEVSPDGKSIFMVTLGNNIVRYNIAAASFTTISSFSSPAPIISGFEFVPGSQFGAGGHDRLYVSYHYWTVPSGYGELVYYDLDNLPAGKTAATGSYPSGTVAAGFGFSEIERAKNGNLYLAYNSKYWPNGYGYYDMPYNGTLYTLDPVTGVMAQVSVGATPVSINTDPGSWGYYIQNQIDGENYNSTNWNTGSANFTVNGKGNEDPFSVPIGHVPSIWFCNEDTSKLILKATINGYISGHSITVEKGAITWDPDLHFPVFTPAPGAPYVYGPVSGLITKDSVNILSVIPALLGYYGDIRVTYTTTGCSADRISRKLFQLHSAKALINFGLQGPPSAGCPSGGVQNRKILDNAFGIHGTVTTPFCDSGWLGAASATLINGTSTLTGVTVVDSYRIVTEGPGVFYAKAYSTMPSSLAFSTLADGYFLFNYNTAKGGPIYKITAFVKTTECDTIKAHSYFKIIDGGPSGNFWKMTDPSAMQLEEVHVFPNPATDKIHVAWHSNANTAAAIVLIDIMGRVVLQQALPQAEGENELNINVSQLAPGIYHYRLQTGNGEFSGHITKE